MNPSAQYDALPYEGHPDPIIHPDRMAAVAWLYGVEAAALDGARVLEIGCATGAHLIPMACQLPGATFVGFDFSAAQIELARQAAAAAGLTNISFEVRDIRDDHRGLGEFDYIFGHGVYSWVPPAVKEALLSLIHQHLAPRGVAMLDYNVHPGWHLRDFFRDLMRFHEQDDLAEATDEVLSSLAFIAEHNVAPGSPFGQMAAGVHKWASGQSKNYLAHEFGGAGGGVPVLFAEFARQARAGGLEILGDTQILNVLPAPLVEAVTRKLDQVGAGGGGGGGGADYVRREQYLDFLRGRDFRRTLLVRNEVPVSREIVPQAVRRLRFSTVARHEPAAQGAVFRCPDGAVLQTGDVALIRAMARLCKAGPAGLMFDELEQAARAEGEGSGAGPSTVEFLGTSLLAVASGGIVQVHVHRPPVAGGIGERPKANAVARAQAAMGSGVASSMLQRDWGVSDFERGLLKSLDGTRTIGQLEQMVKDQGGAKEQMAASLEWFAHVGILVD